MMWSLVAKELLKLFIGPLLCPVHYVHPVITPHPKASKLLIIYCCCFFIKKSILQGHISDMGQICVLIIYLCSSLLLLDVRNMYLCLNAFIRWYYPWLRVSEGKERQNERTGFKRGRSREIMLDSLTILHCGISVWEIIVSAWYDK